MTPTPHITDLRFALTSSEVKAYQIHFCKIEGKWLRQTNLACGEEWSTQVSHSGESVRLSNEYTTPFLVSEVPLSVKEIVASPHVTDSGEDGSHFRLMPYTLV